MTEINVDQFAAMTFDWAQERGGGFKRYWPVKGGWEGWAQVDLAAYVLYRDSTFDILREQPVFDTGRVDLLLNGADKADRQILVEMKVQSFENRTRFVTGVAADVDKFERRRRREWQGSPCVMMAIAFEENDVRKIQGFKLPDGKRYFTVLWNNTENALLLAIWLPGVGWVPQTSEAPAEAEAVV